MPVVDLLYQPIHVGSRQRERHWLIFKTLPGAAPREGTRALILRRDFLAKARAKARAKEDAKER
jgi:hypothetical protein